MQYKSSYSCKEDYYRDEPMLIPKLHVGLLLIYEWERAFYLESSSNTSFEKIPYLGVDI